MLDAIASVRSMEESESLIQVIITSGANFRMYEHFEFLARASENAANRHIEGLLKRYSYPEVSDPYRYPVYISRYSHTVKFDTFYQNKRISYYFIKLSVIKSMLMIIQDCRQEC